MTETIEIIPLDSPVEEVAPEHGIEIKIEENQQTKSEIIEIEEKPKKARGRPWPKTPRSEHDTSTNHGKPVFCATAFGFSEICGITVHALMHHAHVRRECAIDQVIA